MVFTLFNFYILSERYILYQRLENFPHSSVPHTTVGTSLFLVPMVRNFNQYIYIYQPGGPAAIAGLKPEHASENDHAHSFP